MKPTTRSRLAFTLIELLIVISIMVLLLSIAVPAFSSMMYSSEQSMAENALRTGLNAARDAAVRAGAGRDACAVFIYENQRTAIVPCLRVGTINDVDPTGVNAWVKREIFVPVAGFEPVRMPKSWMVRGYAPPGTIDPPAAQGALGLWYEKTNGRQYDDTKGNWVFPETQFYNDQAGDQGFNRQSFMVRFEGGTGTVKMDSAASLVLWPSEWTTFRNQHPWDTYNAQDDSDGAKFVARVLAAPANPPSATTQSLSMAERQELLGDQASDTILVKSVAQLALYNEKKLASALSATLGQTIRVDDTTGCLYQHKDPQTNLPDEPTYVAGLPTMNSDDINAWIQGVDPNGNAVNTESRLYVVQKYLGWLQEITGSKLGQGVTQ